jgi:crotonobetainyl-CoA hydratase
MGGGMEIALACDLIIASDNAKFALPEPKVGLAALAGGMQRLPRQIGMKNAMGMMLTGRHVEALEAKELGIVNQVVPLTELITTANGWAKQIEACSPMSIRATKQVAYDSLSEANLEKSMSGHYPAVADLFKSEDFIEGPVAFAEKRLPNWKGK